MSKKDEFKKRVEDLFPVRNTRCIWFTAAGVAVGAAGAFAVTNQLVNANDMDYALSRVKTLTSVCKNEPVHVLDDRIQLRVGKPMRSFTINDHLIAIDYLLDRIDAKRCIG